MIERLILPAALLTQIQDEAGAAFPRECCGLLVGQWNGLAADVFLAHPVMNLAERDDRFEIDPLTQFTLDRALRGTGREIVGCYHSHPNGRAEPSQTDADVASEAGFVWLIVGVRQTTISETNAFGFDGAKFHPVVRQVLPSEKAA